MLTAFLAIVLAIGAVVGMTVAVASWWFAKQRRLRPAAAGATAVEPE